MVRGSTKFFIQPGETVKEMSKATLLEPNQGLWISAKEEFKDEKNVKRRPGDLWLVTGPGEYWKPIEAEIHSHANAVVALESFGVYIFRPVLFFGSIFGILLLVYIINRYILL